MYTYSPHTGELISTDNPASWMQTTHIAPPVFDTSTEGCFFRDGAWVIVPADNSAEKETAIAAIKGRIVALEQSQSRAVREVLLGGSTDRLAALDARIAVLRAEMAKA